MLKIDHVCSLMIEEIEDYAILLLDVNGTVMTWNKGAERIKGYKSEEIIGKNFSLFYTQEDREKKLPEKLIALATLKGKAIDEGWRMKKDGTRFWGSILITGIHDENKKLAGFSKITRDLTEKRNTGIIEDAGDVLYTTDARGLFTYISKRCSVLTEYSSEELLGKHFSILIAQEWQARVRHNYHEQVKNKVHKTAMEFLVNTKTGHEKWVEQVVILQLEKDSVKGFHCIVRDITERKKATLLLAEQKKIIEQKNKDILDSINYAKLIQDAIFPPEELIKELLPQSFILFKPKDIISGDFFWVEKFDNKTYIAAVDCTGHGVPGALLSIVGYNLLSKSVNEHGYTKPSEILNRLSSGINKTLRQTIENSGIKDTMDIALCSIDRATNTLEFAGAYNSLYLIRKNELIEIEADRFPIGVFLGGELQKFTNHEMPLEKGDTIYLYSDGYPDQFGGPNGKKLKYKGFKDILLSMQQMPINEQKDTLNRTIEEWKWMSEEQTDDILIIGIRI
ncbi:MAG TPA: PAS domain S-box protein [Bacteroidia bacterium]|nr:PAS domain S-box protein [Bacteroidia bacterium]